MSLLHEFPEGLNSTATFRSVSLAVDSYGQQIKTKSTLYSAIKCNVVTGGDSMKSGSSAIEDFSKNIVVIVDSQYSGAERGGEIEIDSIKYIIDSKALRNDLDGVLHHVEYSCIEQS